MPIINRFGNLLADKKTREKRNIPLTEVEAKTGITRKTLTAWENNKVQRYDASTVETLCRYFGCQPGDLIVLQD